MKIGFISTELPCPTNSGGRIYIWERLKQLKREGHEIYLFSFAAKDELIEYNQLKTVCNEINVYRRIKNFKLFFKSLYSPYCVISRYNNMLQKKLEESVNKGDIDIIIADIPQVTLNIPSQCQCPVVLTQHNIEYSTFFNIAKCSKKPIKKLVFYFEGIKMYFYEKKLYSRNKIDMYSFISENDKRIFEIKFNKKNTALIPFGIHVKEVKYKLIDNYNIVFTGTMDYQPNIDAVNWFCNNVFPKIKARLPIAKFFIVGKNPTQEVLNLANRHKDIIVTGKVNSVNEYINNCNLVVIPLQSGGGVKIKLFEALERYKVIVGTDKAVEGTKLKNREHLLITNDSEQFANMCIDVLANPQKYEIMVNKAVELIQEIYSWDNIGKLYSNLLKSLVKRKNKELS